MSEQGRFTPEQWRTLQFGPFWMFSAIVGAYRRFDPREYQAFVRCLEAAALADGRLRREVLATVVENRARLTREYGTDRRTIGVGLGEVADVLGRTAADEATEFKAMLVSEIGEGVARARGRFGSEMSEEDANRLALAAQLLYFELDPADG